LIGAAEERCLVTISHRDNSSLAMYQTELLRWQDLHPHLSRAKEFEKTLKALGGVLVDQFFRFGRAPLTAHGEVGRARRLHVLRIEIGIADYTDGTGDGFESLPCDLQDG